MAQLSGNDPQGYRSANSAVEVQQQGFKEPKGKETRDAIAKHLAMKLKMPEDSDPTQIYEQYQQLLFGEGEKNKTGAQQHWDNIIINARRKINEEKERRRLRLMSDEFLNR